MAEAAAPALAGDIIIGAGVEAETQHPVRGGMGERVG